MSDVVGAAVEIEAPGGFTPQVAIAFGASGASATAVDRVNPLPTAIVAAPVTPIDRSGTVAATGVAQSVVAPNATRRGFFLQNLGPANLWLDFGVDAHMAAPSLLIASGQLYESHANGTPGTAISVIGTAGGTFSAREW